jgi:ligand-binding sensor domain-containing protein
MWLKDPGASPILIVIQSIIHIYRQMRLVLSILVINSQQVSQSIYKGQRMKKSPSLLISSLLIWILIISCNSIQTSVVTRPLPDTVSASGKTDQSPSILPATNTPLPVTNQGIEAFYSAPTHNPKEWNVYWIASDLIQGEIHFIAESAKGKMWFAGIGGLVSFDGDNWAVHLNQDDLKGKKISALATSPGENLWVGTDSDGILRFDGEKWITYTIENGLLDNHVNSLAATEDGIVWAGSRSGLSRFEKEQWTIHQYPLYLSGAYMDEMVIGSDGVVLIGAHHMLIRYNNKEWDSLWSGSQVSCITTAQDGSVWFGTVDAGIIHLIGEEIIPYKNLEFERFPPDGIAITSDNVVRIASWGGYQIAHYDGNVWRTLDGEDITRPEYDDYYGGYTGGMIFTMFKSKDGALWLGTARGVYRFIPES